jgi:hypothetical protein
MGASERVAVAGLAACAFTLAACDVLLGLGQWSDVACASPDYPDSACADVRETGVVHETGPYEVGPPDTGPEAEAGAVDLDAADADADAGDVVVYPDGPPVPSVYETWAHWPMPNPDAAIAPDSSTLLPHTMTYDAGVDGSATTVYDVVTKLTWSRVASSASTLSDAWTACGHLGAGWRVPTRIELLSLVDFTQPNGQPMVDPGAFPATPVASYWTSSAVPGDGGPSGYWTIDFSTGLAGTTPPAASQVRCVQGGVQ